MNRQLLVSLAVVALTVPEQRSLAHGACTAPTCCSPHGATSSTFGSQFSNCSYDGTLYSRDYLCPIGPCAHPEPTQGCDVEHGRSHGTPDHGPVTYTSWDFEPLVAPSQETSWPPNHELVDVDLVFAFVPGLPTDVYVLEVTHDEDDDGGDAVIVDDDTVRIRAERDGNGDGRTYTVTFEAEDTMGNSCADSVTVCVPHHPGAGCP